MRVPHPWQIFAKGGIRVTTREALDKDEGFVKAQITRAVREHRLISQRG